MGKRRSPWSTGPRLLLRQMRSLCFLGPGESCKAITQIRRPQGGGITFHHSLPIHVSLCLLSFPVRGAKTKKMGLSGPKCLLVWPLGLSLAPRLSKGIFLTGLSGWVKPLLFKIHGAKSYVLKVISSGHPPLCFLFFLVCSDAVFPCLCLSIFLLCFCLTYMRVLKMS